MVAKFETAIGTVLKHEGGLVNNPNDPGGITNYGISLRWALQQMKESGVEDFDVDGDGDVDADDIRKMPVARAMELYEKYFWKPDYAMMTQELATKVFDAAVNMGHSRAHSILADAINAVGVSGVSRSSRLSELCLSTTMNPREVLAAFRMGMWGWYQLLIARNAALLRNGINVPNFAVFENGWRRRAFS